MTDDRSIERAARAWLESGPTQAPDHVVQAALDRIGTTGQERAWRVAWRGIQIGRVARAGASVAAVAVILVGGALVLQPRPGPAVGPSTPPPVSPSMSPSPSPTSTSGSPSASPEGAIALTETFVSSRHGFSVNYPLGWRITRASADWTSLSTDWGSPVVDELRGRDIRLSIASQRVPPGDASADRLQAMVDAVGPCEPSLPAPAPAQVGGLLGTVAMNGCSTRELSGTMTPSGFAYVVLVLVDDRVYDFILDGNVDPATLQSILETVTFDPGSAVDP